MRKWYVVAMLLYVVFLVLITDNGGGKGKAMAVTGTPDGSEQWGYVEVRPKAHMFWWHYKSPQRTQYPNNSWPIILWLQGGPGGSGVGIGNFQEIGPLDTFLKPRNSTWLQKADLLFVDNPVGTGYSYVEDKSLLVKTDEEAAADLTTLLISIFNGDEVLRKSPLYIVAESYGGKFAVTLGLSAHKAIEAGKLKLILGGIALGNSWISPEDFVFSWGPLLKDVSRLDNAGAEKSKSLAEEIKQLIKEGKWQSAYTSQRQLQNVIIFNNFVNFYNFLTDFELNLGNSTTAEQSKIIAAKQYSRFLDSSRVLPSASTGDGDMNTLMNVVVKKKLGIIPKDVQWGGQADDVSSAFNAEYMKPRISEVDELLAKGVNVTVYNGQLDVICSTKGAQAWVEKLKWEGMQTFLNSRRIPMYCGNGEGTKGFTRSYQNFRFYWILQAGHFVPVDQPCVSLDMIGNITQSPVVPIYY